MQIYLLRHTPVDVEPFIYYGQTEVPLKENYLLEFKSIKDSISLSDDVRVYSSPLSRCSKLSTYIAGERVQFDARLKEINFGDWEMKKVDDIDLAKSMKWTENILHEPCPNGESFHDVYKRLLSFWEELINLDYKKVLIVSHSGVIRTLLSIVLGLPLENAFILKLDYGSLSCVQLDNQVKRVLYINRKLIQDWETL